MGITNKEYAEIVAATRVYPQEEGIPYVILGLAGEAGEIANRYKKFIRNKVDYKGCREDLIKELGDVMWYAYALAAELGVPMEEVLRRNIAKVLERRANGTITAVEHKGE